MPQKYEIENKNETNIERENSFLNLKKHKYRIRKTNEKLDEDEDDNTFNYNLKKPNLQNYSRNTKYGGNIYLGSNTERDLFLDNSRSIGKLKKKLLIPNYDQLDNDINEDDYRNERKFLKPERNEYKRDEYKRGKTYFRNRIEEVKGRNTKNNNYLKNISKTQDYDDL